MRLHDTTTALVRTADPPPGIRMKNIRHSAAQMNLLHSLLCYLTTLYQLQSLCVG
jgi:hypothetical protein